MADICPTCKSAGHLNYHCTHCSGTGSIWSSAQYGTPTRTNCPSCATAGNGLAVTTTAAPTVPAPVG
jgi:RecJ-like exonuclease